MRIGYLFRGYLADVKLGPDGKEVSSPDGNASYSWCIEHECAKRKHKLIPLGREMDEFAARTLGRNAFRAFSPTKRAVSYQRMQMCGWGRASDRKFPELDMVLVEWRWPIPGRNTPDDRGKPGYQDDLERQEAVLRHYAGKCPIVVWDLDHKLTDDDFRMWNDAGAVNAVIETSAFPRQGRVRVHPPCVVNDLLQFPIDRRPPLYSLGYIGSRYERDDVVDEWIAPIVTKTPHSNRAKFWGKWEPTDEVRARWPGIGFGRRIGIGEFWSVYSRVAAVPLLAKRSYFETGFVTPRIAEAIVFGSVPIGLGCHRGIEEYVDNVARTPEELLERATWLREIAHFRREIVREEAAHRLKHTDARHFVDTLESLAR